MVSCDTYFYTLGAKLGINRLDTILQAFGFGSKTGVDLPHEKAGIIPSPAWKLQALGAPWYEGDTVETAIGQEYQLATPLELAMATATLANQGHIIKPHLFLSATNSATDPKQSITNAKQEENTVNASSTIIPVFFPKNEKAINKAEKIINKKLILNNISQTDWKIISRAMQKVITNPYGTGLHFGRNPGYTVAAKTGTSQVFGHQRNEESTQANLPEKLRNNHLFIAYAPVAKPQIALAVIVEHNAIAAKISRKLLDYYLITQDHLKAKKKKPKDSA
jgi:penicillin-binding protein 2